MRKRNFCLLATAFLFLIMGTSSSESDMIYWSEDYKLTWNDFAGNPAYAYKSISALTSSGIVHSKGCKDGIINFDVKSYFERNESWVKAEGRTDHHLIHEQIHFDITELYARKLRRALSEQRFRCGQELVFENFVTKFIQDWHEEQHDFDETSRHSINKAVQEEWEKRIEVELLLLDEYR